MVSEDKWIAIVKEANKWGFYGWRVVDVKPQPAENATSEDHILLTIDRGPATASETW